MRSSDLPADSDLDFPHPLAYEEWFSHFTQPTSRVDMYTVSMVSGHSVVIVPVQSIRRSCHLIPHFGKRINRTLTTEDSLDWCRKIYVSDFVDLYTYQFFND
ncbi:hypothetical protein JB92DRAFT_2867027 [Gautieria morchelliformis]|nr:hypothetical protein JB92DRAFT_2867027 [Gautieria morchelliformis]